MRRTDRQVCDRQDLLTIISRCKVCRLGVWDGTEVYLVPLNFGYEEKDGRLSLFFHCSKEGRKLNILRERPQAAFEMDGDHLLIESDTPCGYSYAYCCVMGQGLVEVLEDEAGKVHALNLIMRHQAGRDVVFTPSMARSVCVLRLSVTTISGKLHACPADSAHIVDL